MVAFRLCVFVPLCLCVLLLPACNLAAGVSVEVPVIAEVDPLAGYTGLVGFTSKWCAKPCAQIKPRWEALEAEGHAVRVVDYDREGELARRFRLRSLPTTIALEDGREIARLVGTASERQLRALSPTPPKQAVPVAVFHLLPNWVRYIEE